MVEKQTFLKGGTFRRSRPGTQFFMPPRQRPEGAALFRGELPVWKILAIRTDRSPGAR